MRSRQFHSSILPAMRSAWTDPAWHEPDPLYDGQAIGDLNIQLAKQLPEQHPSPYSTMASQALSSVLSSAQTQVPQLSPEELEQYCKKRLEKTQAQIAKLLTFAEDKP
jgi:hypothetical protein